MIKQLLISSLFLSQLSLFGQRAKTQIGMSSFIQWNNYPSFSTLSNSVNNSTIKMKGNDYAISGFYKYPLKKAGYVKAGIGYCRHVFNNIKENTNLFSRNARTINYPYGSSTFGYVSNRYWYNNLSLTLGVEKLFEVKNDIDITGGVEVLNFCSISQAYNIPGTNNDLKYKNTNFRYFGLSTVFCIELLKNFNKISIGPILRVPVFETWKQDAVFPNEKNSENRSKWLRGSGIGITVAYSFAKNN